MGIQRQQGSSLVEVMIALFVLAIGILGVLAMQTTSMKYNQSAYSYSQAVYLANDMAERIRSNFQVASTYATVAIPTDAAGIDKCKTSACNAADLVAWDLLNWNTAIQNRLPMGKGAITSVTNSDREYLLIKIEFDDSRVPGAAAVNGGDQEYALLVEVI